MAACEMPLRDGTGSHSSLGGDVAEVAPRPKMLNQIMAGCLISFTGFRRAERDVYAERVRKMGGDFSPNFTDRITHLVAIAPGSQKYHVAVDLGTPIVTAEWIGECFRQQKLLPIDDFPVPLFAQSVVSVTGLDAKARKRLQTLVEDNGGKFVGHLDQGCTHLLAEERSGKKYEAALHWKIKQVTPQWVFESVNQKGLLDEKDFEVPERPDRTIRVQEATRQSQSQAEPVAGPIVSSLVPPVTPSEGRTSSVFPVSRATVTAPRRRRDEVEEVDEPVDARSNSLKAPPAKRRKIKDQRQSRSLEFPADDDERMLELFDGAGYRFYIACADVPEKERLVQWIVRCGATRFDRFDSSITHVIVGAGGAQEAAALTRYPSWRDARIIDSQWLEECDRVREVVPTSRFELSVNSLRQLEKQSSFSASDVHQRLQLSSGPSQRILSSSTPGAVRLSSSSSKRIQPKGLKYTPLSGSSKTSPALRVAVTNFHEGVEREEVKSMISQIGATYTSHLGPRNTHLIARVGDGRKFWYAKANGIPIVSKAWLVESKRLGRLADVVPYRMELAAVGEGEVSEVVAEERNDSLLEITKRTDEPGVPSDVAAGTLSDRFNHHVELVVERQAPPTFTSKPPTSALKNPTVVPTVSVSSHPTAPRLRVHVPSHPTSPFGLQAAQRLDSSNVAQLSSPAPSLKYDNPDSVSVRNRLLARLRTERQNKKPRKAAEDHL